MIRCTNCNTINPDDALFCSNCNSFLEWTGVPATPDEIAAAKSGKAPATTADSATAQSAAEPEAATAPDLPEAEPEAAPVALAEAPSEPLPQPGPAALPEPSGKTESIVQQAIAAQPPPVVAAEPAAAVADEPGPAPIREPPTPVQTASAESGAAGQPVLPPSPTFASVPSAAGRPLPAPPPPPPPPPPYRSMAGAPPPTQAPATPQPKPEPPPEPLPDTESLVKPAPEPVKEEFRYRAAPARRREEPSGAATPSAAVTAAPVAEQPAARRPGFIAQVKQAIGMDAEATASVGAPAATPSSAGASAAPATAVDTATQAPVKPDEPAAVKPQASEPAAVRPQATHLAGQQPAAVKPAAQQVRRPTQPQKPPDEPEYNPGDLICSNCGAGNDPARRFCRRCGTSLVTAVVAQRPPWYRRIFRRRQRTLMAGERPKWMGDKERGRRFNWVHSMLRFQRMFAAFAAIVAIGGVSAYAFLPNVHQQVDQGIGQVRKMFLPNYQPITPTAFTAPSLADHPIALAFDQGSNTFWAANRTDGPTITVNFRTKFDLGVVVFQTSPADKFAQYDRPKTVLLSFPDSSAAPITLNLKDDKAPIISGGLNAPGVTSVVISFTDYYPADQTGQDVLALCDIQFQERR